MNPCCEKLNTSYVEARRAADKALGFANRTISSAQQQYESLLSKFEKTTQLTMAMFFHLLQMPDSYIRIYGQESYMHLRGFYQKLGGDVDQLPMPSPVKREPT